MAATDSTLAPKCSAAVPGWRIPRRAQSPAELSEQAGFAHTRYVHGTPPEDEHAERLDPVQ